jgi:porin
VRKAHAIYCFLSIIVIFTTPVLTLAYDINDKLNTDTTLTGVYQYGDIDHGEPHHPGRGSGILDVRMNFHPTKTDEFQLTASYTDQDGLNAVSPFSLAPYDDDLKSDLRHINGRDRSYLLEAWYKHKFILSQDSSLAITGGIIDSSCYIDDNAFANCETTQFMNEIFVSQKNVNLPSYDIGGAAELEISKFTIRAVEMATKNEEGRHYNYHACQLGYKADTGLGEGNYRIYGFLTSDKFQNDNESGHERLKGWGVSCDQKLGEILGVFTRLGWQDDEAAVDHEKIYSLGLNVNGKLWCREKDEIGVGYAYLEGADEADINHTNAAEAYVKFQVCDFSDLTFDVQYIQDRIKEDKDPEGFIYGIRLNTYF